MTSLFDELSDYETNANMHVNSQTQSQLEYTNENLSYNSDLTDISSSDVKPHIDNFCENLSYSPDIVSVSSPAIILNAPTESKEVVLSKSPFGYNVRPKPYPEPSTRTLSDSACSSNHLYLKHGNYKPMDWTNDTVLKLLVSTNDGRFVIADAKTNNGSLSDEGQNTLTKLLINYLFQDECKGTDLFFRKIAKIISEIFPNELESIYFIPAKTEGSHQSHAKGKLIERWKNVSRRLRKVGALESQTKKCYSKEVHVSNIFSDDIQHAKEWLKNDGLNAVFEEVIRYWEITFDIRNSEIVASQPGHLSDLFESWPILQGPRGFELVEKDFELQYSKEYSNVFSNFLNNWSNFTQIIVNIRRSSVKDKHAKELLSQLDAYELKKDFRTCNNIKLLLLPYLIPTKTQIKNCNKDAKKKSWKPSLDESAAAFVTHVTNLTQLEEDVHRRRLKYMEYGSTIQPFIVLVGKDLSSIEASYIRVNNQFWTVKCPLHALSICFKTYFSFHCAYPRECYETCLLLQTHVFNLATAFDKPTAITRSISNKLKSLIP